MKRNVTIRQALQHVADHPVLKSDRIIDLPIHELVARTLFEIANGAQAGDRGSLHRANIARGMIFDRMVGKRRAGSHPATRREHAVEFADLTAGEVTQ
jgi:hypothetical protein